MHSRASGAAFRIARRNWPRARRRSGGNPRRYSVTVVASDLIDVCLLCPYWSSAPRSRPTEREIDVGILEPQRGIQYLGMVNLDRRQPDELEALQLAGPLEDTGIVLRE